MSMDGRSNERELRALAAVCRRQAKGASTCGAAGALTSMADSYEEQADRLCVIQASPPKAS